MKYGRFDDARREYVITRPDTPLPWINYLGSEDYLGLISNTAGGYSFYRDARLRRLTRYRYNNAPLDVGGRYVYVRDDDPAPTGAPAGSPSGSQIEDYECRHGMGYTIIGSRSAGIRTETCTSCPARDARDLARHITNERARSGPTVALQRHRVVPLGRPRRRHQLPAQLLHRRGGGRGRRHLSQDRVPGTARPLRLLRLFRATGRLRHPARRLPGALSRLGPAAGRGGGVATNSIAHGWQPIGSHHVRLELGAGETREVDLRARLRGESRRRQVRPARLADHQQAAGPTARSRSTPSGCGAGRFDELAA